MRARACDTAQKLTICGVLARNGGRSTAWIYPRDRECLIANASDERSAWLAGSVVMRVASTNSPFRNVEAAGARGHGARGDRAAKQADRSRSLRKRNHCKSSSWPSNAQDAG